MILVPSTSVARGVGTAFELLDSLGEGERADDVDAETATTLNVEPARTAVETITTAYVDPNEGDPSDLVRDSSIPHVEEVSAAVATASASLCVTKWSHPFPEWAERRDSSLSPA